MKKIITYALVFFTITFVVIYLSMLIYKREEKSKFNTSLELVVRETSFGWSYDIYKNKKIIVQQDIIPVVPGKQYFKTKQDAKKIGLLVLNKLKSNKSPIITLEELEESDINYKK